MIIKYLTNTKKSVNLLFLCGAVCFLASCSSSNKVASSFGKRKYTKGHFTDAVAKLNTHPGSYTIDNKYVSVNLPQQLATESPVLANTTVAAAKRLFSAPVKAAAANHIAQHKTTPIAITKTAAVNSNNNVSVNQAAKYEDSQANMGKDSNDRGEHGHHYLMDFLLCLLVCIGLYLIAGILGGGLGTLFGVLGTIAAIAAIIFFVLWILSIAG